MKKSTRLLKTIFFLGSLAIFGFCSGPDKKPGENKPQPVTGTIRGDTVTEIDGEIRGIFQDSKNNLWFASNGNGVFRYDGKTIVQFTTRHGLCSNYAWNVKEGKDGKIWFQTNLRPRDADALCYFDGHSFITVEVSPWLSQATDLDTQTGDLIFGYYYNSESLVKIQLPQTSPIQNETNIRHHYDIFCSCQDSRGNLWFGTATAGICKYDGKTFTWFDNKELGSAVRSIFEDRNGIIWAGNNGDGLFRYDGKDFINFSREKNLHNPDFNKYPGGKPGLMSRVWTITADNRGKLWVGTIDNGVWAIDSISVTNYTTKDGLAIDAVWVIYTDKQGRLWFGSAGAGVFYFDGKRFKKFSSVK